MAFESLRDQQIERLLLMPKRVTNPSARNVTDANHDKRDYLFESADGAGTPMKIVKCVPPDAPRLFFRALNLEDIGHLQVIFSDPLAMRHYPATKSIAETREWIERSMTSYERHGHGLWAVCLRETGEFLGQCGLIHQELRANPDKEIGYSFQRRFWGRGYATEAARAVKEAALTIFGFPYVVSFIAPDNEPSIKVARRIGMELEEILPPEANKWNRTVHVYSQTIRDPNLAASGL